MYPYRDRLRWLASGRYGHLVHAIDRRTRPIQDTTLEARVEALRAWNRVRFVVLLLLSIGLTTAGTALFARLAPGADAALNAWERVATAASTLSGFLTLAYLFVLRLCGQLEIDILAILTLDHSEKS